jgi:hypothetical protein
MSTYTSQYASVQGAPAQIWGPVVTVVVIAIANFLVWVGNEHSWAHRRLCCCLPTIFFASNRCDVLLGVTTMCTALTARFRCVLRSSAHCRPHLMLLLLLLHVHLWKACWGGQAPAPLHLLGSGHTGPSTPGKHGRGRRGCRESTAASSNAAALG